MTDYESKPTVHAVPPFGSGVMPCCGRTLFEAPTDERMTTYEHLVTCAAKRDVDPAVTAEAAARNSLDLVKELRARAETAEAQVQRVRDVLADPQWTVRRWIDDTRMVGIPAVLDALDEDTSC